MLCSFSVISASELTNESAYSSIDDSTNVINDNNLIKENDLDNSKLSTSDSNVSPNDYDTVIHVGQSVNGTGNGTYENPFSSIDLACNNISGENNVSIKIFNGTYQVTSLMNINATKINIEGINGPVVLDYSSKDKNYHSFVFEEDSNITFNNIIFDGTTIGYQVYFISAKESNYIEFNNCTFIFPRLKAWMNNAGEFPGHYKFYNCIFESISTRTIPIFLSSSTKREVLNIDFDYCSFNLPKVNYLCSLIENETTNELINNISVNNSWFSQNLFPGFLSVKTMGYDSGKTLSEREFPVNRYAIFSVSRNYLGNNQYEISGKLTWNGTENQDGMENFMPMVVTLKSVSGEINQTTTLINGSFKTVYTSLNVNHKVTATLDNEGIDLEFTTVNITADPVSIYYGEDQNITFNFTQPITANVTVTVSNGSYNKTEKVEVIGKDSFTYTVPDTLKEGTYDIEINLAENNLFGSNATTLTVFKVSEYTFNIDIQDNGNVKAGDDVVITVELPEDVSGNVTVKVNDNPEITKEATPNTIITINNLVGGNNNITIAYTGNDKYAAKTSEPQVVTAQKVSAPDGDNALNITAPADSATPTYSINMPKDATGNLTVIVDGKDKYTKELVNGSATITLPELSAGKHDINVTYTGDAKYESISKTTSVNVPAKSTPAKTPVAKKAATKITAKKKTFKAKKKVKKYTITLKSGKKPVKKVWVTLKIKGKKLLKAKTNAKGKATFKIKKLTKKGKYKAVIKFKGNKNFKASSKKVKITIKK